MSDHLSTRISPPWEPMDSGRYNNPVPVPWIVVVNSVDVKIVTLIVVLSALVAPLPGVGAFHPVDDPEVASAGGSGVGWVSFAGSSTGTDLTVDTEVRNPQDTWQIGVAVQSRDGTFLGGAIATALSRDEGYRVTVQGPIEINEEELEQGPTMPRGGLAVDISDVSGDFVVIVWTAGTGASWNAQVHGEDTTVHDQIQGEDTFLYRMRDLQGPVSATLTSQSERVNVQVMTRAVQQIDHHLVGSFNTGDTHGVDVTTATGPGGIEICTCNWWYAFGERSMEPGEYVFEVNEVGADMFIDGFLGGADVRLPEWE